METGELHPGKMELPEGFTEIIGYLRSDEGKAWQEKNFRPVFAQQEEQYVFYAEKSLVGYELQDRWDSAHTSGNQVSPDGPSCGGFSYLRDRIPATAGTFREDHQNEVILWTPMIPPEGAPPLKGQSFSKPEKLSS